MEAIHNSPAIWAKVNLDLYCLYLFYFIFWGKITFVPFGHESKRSTRESIRSVLTVSPDTEASFYFQLKIITRKKKGNWTVVFQNQPGFGLLYIIFQQDSFIAICFFFSPQSPFKHQACEDWYSGGKKLNVNDNDRPLDTVMRLIMHRRGVLLSMDRSTREKNGRDPVRSGY